MAARRLLIVMLILLGISTLAAALVPPQGFRDDTESTTTGATGTGTATEPEPVLPTGTRQEARIFVGGKRIPVVPLPLGDQLYLTICSREAQDLLEIPRIGRVEPITPGVPVYFNLLPDEEGSYAINFVEADTVAARIEVEPRKPGAPAEPKKLPPTDCPAPVPR